MPWSLALMQIALGLMLLSGYATIIQNKQPLRPNAFLLLLGLYLLIRFITIYFSPDPARSFRAVYKQDWTLLMLPLLATIEIDSRTIRNAIQTLLISATLVGVYGIVQMFLGVEYIRGKNLAAYGNLFRATGSYSFYLTFAGNQLMFFAFLLGFFLLEKQNKQRRLIQAAMLIILFLSIISTFGRSAWLAIILATGLGTLLVNRRLFGYAMLGISIIVGIAMVISPDIQERIFSIFDMSKNAARLNLWYTSIEMIKANPFTGLGPGLFNKFFEMYKVPGVYDAYGHSHNDYLNIAVNSGIPALLIWLSAWISWFAYTLKRYLSSEGEDKQRLLGSILAITAIGFAAIFQCYYTDLENNIVWLFIAGIALVNKRFQVPGSEL